MTRTPAPHEQRVIDEQEALSIKLSALAAFVSSPKIHSVDIGERILMGLQIVAMTSYLGILAQRTHLFDLGAR